MSCKQPYRKVQTVWGKGQAFRWTYGRGRSEEQVRGRQDLVDPEAESAE